MPFEVYSTRGYHSEFGQVKTAPGPVLTGSFLHIVYSVSGVRIPDSGQGKAVHRTVGTVDHAVGRRPPT